MNLEYLQKQILVVLQETYFFCDLQTEKYFSILRAKEYKLIDLLLFIMIGQIIAFLILHYAFKFLKCLVFGIINIRTNLIKFTIKYIPGIKNKIKQKINDSVQLFILFNLLFCKLADFQKSQDKYTYKKTTRIPDAGIKISTIQEKTKKMLELDQQRIASGRISGCKYYEENELKEQIVEFSKQFLYHNLLHFDLYVSVRQMESELIAMTSTLFSGDVKNPYGVATQGGSESICMAVLAARNYCEKYKGIKQPEMIASCTIHTAFDKACSMFKVKLIKIDVDSRTFQIDLKKMKKAINKHTILIAGSCPNFPHGIVDPLEEMAAIAKKNNILFHVDCCLGSLNLPFAKELGQPLPKFDFSLEGVTSISMDHHKHGLAPKGVSVVLYKTSELRHSQYYASLEWPGGAYGTPSIGGSRSGAPVSGAWFAMMHLGKAGYKDLALKIFNALNYLKKEITAIPEVQLFGNPIVNTLAFRSKDEKRLPSYSVKKALDYKGWNLTGTQKPPGIHISITQSFAKQVEQFIIDLKLAIIEVQTNPTKYETSSEAAIYGTAQVMPVGEISEFRDFVIGLVDITLTV